MISAYNKHKSDEHHSYTQIPLDVPNDIQQPNKFRMR